MKFWDTNPQVDYIIGLKLAQKYRFAEAAAEQKRALDFDPAYLPARRELAEDMLRLGQDDEGWALAQEVHAQDDYDVTSFNLVTLHDQMAKFKTLTNANFIVEMSAHEAELYGNRVLDLLGTRPGNLVPQVRRRTHPAHDGGYFSRPEGFRGADLWHAGQSRLSRRLFRLGHHGQQPGFAGAQSRPIGRTFSGMSSATLSR